MPTKEQLDRLKAVVPCAQATQSRWHIPSSVTLAPRKFDSNWGTSKQTVGANDHFDVKLAQKDRCQSCAEMRTAEFAEGSKTPHIESAGSQPTPPLPQIRSA